MVNSGNGNNGAGNPGGKTVSAAPMITGISEQDIASIADRHRKITGIVKNEAWDRHIPIENYDLTWARYHLAMAKAFEHKFDEAEELVNQAVVMANEVVYEHVRKTLTSNQDNMLPSKYTELSKQLEDLYSILLGEEGVPNKSRFADPLATIFHGILKEVENFKKIAEEFRKKREELTRRISVLNERIGKWLEGSQAETLTLMYQMVNKNIKNTNAQIKEDEVQIESLERTVEMFDRLRKTLEEEKKALEVKSAEVGASPA